MIRIAHIETTFILLLLKSLLLLNVAKKMMGDAIISKLDCLAYQHIMSPATLALVIKGLSPSSPRFVIWNN